MTAWCGALTQAREGEFNVMLVIAVVQGLSLFKLDAMGACGQKISSSSFV